MTRTPAQINRDADARAVASGHHAWIQDGGAIKVASNTYGAEGKHYLCTFHTSSDGFVTFTCTPRGAQAFRDDHLYAESGKPGVVPCFHCALAARSLRRHGLARLDAQGRWEITDKARALQVPPEHAPAVERDASGVVHLVCPCGWRVNYAGTADGAQRSMDAHVEASKPVSVEDLFASFGRRD